MTTRTPRELRSTASPTDWVIIARGTGLIAGPAELEPEARLGNHPDAHAAVQLEAGLFGAGLCAARPFGARPCGARLFGAGALRRPALRRGALRRPALRREALRRPAGRASARWRSAARRADVGVVAGVLDHDRLGLAGFPG